MNIQRKRIIKIAGFTLGFFLLAVLALVIHIALVQNSYMSYGPAIQLSRIDFQEPVDSLSADQIKGSLLHMEGVQHAYFNIPDGVVVYSHDPKVQSAQSIYDKIQQEYHLGAEKYVVSADAAASSCPITGKNSILAKAGNLLVNVFR